jgi:hypothetical protein
VDGYGIAGIEWSDRVGATKVTISKDGKFATLTFNQALLAQQAPPNAPPAPPQMPPSVPLVPSPDLRQAPQARVRGVIQRKPTAATPQVITPQQQQRQERIRQKQAGPYRP